MRRGLFREHGINRRPVTARTKLFDGSRLTKQAGNPGKRFEMIGAGCFRRQEKHNNINPFFIDGVEFDGLV
jgi:uncharacterized protein YbbC (DUF1343 family)